MNPEAWLGLLGTVVASILGSWIVVHAGNHERELKDASWRGEIQTKVDAMWRVIFRSSTSDGLNSGLLQTRSPITVSLNAFDSHPELVQKLKEFYEREGSKLSDLELFVQLENKFSEDFAQFEAEHGLRAVTSVAAACYMLRPGMSIFDHKIFEKKAGSD